MGDTLSLLVDSCTTDSSMEAGARQQRRKERGNTYSKQNARKLKARHTTRRKKKQRGANYAMEEKMGCESSSRKSPVLIGSKEQSLWRGGRAGCPEAEEDEPYKMEASENEDNDAAEGRKGSPFIGEEREEHKQSDHSDVEDDDGVESEGTDATELGETEEYGNNHSSSASIIRAASMLPKSDICDCKNLVCELGDSEHLSTFPESKLETENGRLRDLNGKLEKQVSDLKKKLGDSERLSTFRESELETENGRLRDLNGKLEKQFATCEKTRVRNEKLGEQLETLKQHKLRYKEEVSKVARARDTLQTEKQNVEKLCGKLKADTVKLNEELAEIRYTEQKFQYQVQILETEKRDLSSNRAALLSNNEKLERKLSQTREDFVRTERANKDLKATLDQEILGKNRFLGEISKMVEQARERKKTSENSGIFVVHDKVKGLESGRNDRKIADAILSKLHISCADSVFVEHPSDLKQVQNPCILYFYSGSSRLGVEMVETLNTRWKPFASRAATIFFVRIDTAQQQKTNKSVDPSEMRVLKNSAKECTNPDVNVRGLRFVHRQGELYWCGCERFPQLTSINDESIHLLKQTLGKTSPEPKQDSSYDREKILDLLRDSLLR